MIMVPLTTDKLSKVNDKFKFESDVGTHVQSPSLAITYSKRSSLILGMSNYINLIKGDGTKVDFDCTRLSFADLERSILKHAKALQGKEGNAK